MKGPVFSEHQPITDFRLQLITLIAVLTTIFVGGFGIFRFATGSYLIAAADLCIVVIVDAVAFYAWKTRRVERAGVAISVLLSGAVIVVTTLVGLAGAIWVYAVIVFVFYLSPTRLGATVIAVALIGIATVSVGSSSPVFPDQVQLVSFLSSATTTTVFSWFFAHRTVIQREQLIQWATRDPLTGLENRRNLEPELNIAVARYARYKLPCGLIIMDLDNFKEINDTTGHAAGDRVLKSVARIVDSVTRLEDRTFRYGGDEFIVILPDITREGLEVVAGKLVESINTAVRQDGTLVTASIGAALLLPRDDRDSWNRRADQSMYRAKQLGGNRFVVDEELVADHA